MSTSQEALPPALMAGTRKVAVVWISRIYNKKAKEAKDSKPKKK